MIYQYSYQDWNHHPPEYKGVPSEKERSAHPYDFNRQVCNGPTLFVGEGNLSFSLCVAKQMQKLPVIVSTTFEPREKLSALAKRNAATLEKLGVCVLHEIDATRLQRNFRSGFKTIVFQFPNSGSRRPIYGRTANHHLVRRFLRSSSRCLKKKGQVVITTVDSTHYHGAFDIPEAANVAGFSIKSVHPFFRTHWHGYEHCNTLDIGSALRASYRACTWVLKQK